ncbi:MAG: LemA family protein [Kineosporiaceae bacterium]
MDPVPVPVAVAVLALLVGGVALWFAGAFRGLVRLRNLVRQSWQQVDEELRRRYDLVPDLVAVVRDRARPQGDGLDGVTRARAAALAASAAPSLEDRVAAERELSQALDRLFAASEGHISLRSDESFLALRRELTDIQARVTAGRRLYNANVARLDARAQTFPASLVARLVGVGAAQPFGSVSADPRTAEMDLRSPPPV